MIMDYYEEMCVLMSKSWTHQIVNEQIINFVTNHIYSFAGEGNLLFDGHCGWVVKDLCVLLSFSELEIMNELWPIAL